jgi:hypothetical protein
LKRTFVEKKFNKVDNPIQSSIKMEWFKQLRNVVVDSIKVTLSKDVKATLTVFNGKEVDFQVPLRKRVTEIHINKPAAKNEIEYKINYDEDTADAEVIMTLSGEAK